METIQRLHNAIARGGRQHSMQLSTTWWTGRCENCLLEQRVRAADVFVKVPAISPGYRIFCLALCTACVWAYDIHSEVPLPREERRY